MNEDDFWAEIDVEVAGEELFRAVLVIGIGREGGAGQEPPLRLPLAGEHPTEQEAIEAARAAIAAMALHGDGLRE